MDIALESALEKVLHSLNTVSRRPIYEKYDKNVQGNTIWERGDTLVSMTACFRDFPELDLAHSQIGVAIGTGGNPNYAKLDPDYAAQQAICEGALKTAAVGGQWLGATDCLNFGNPEKEDQMGQFVAGVEGIKTACETLEIPIVSGNVSLYNESSGTSIPPSALVSVFARVDDAKIVPGLAPAEGEYELFFIGEMTEALGGSEFLRCHGKSDARLPELSYDRIKQQAEIMQLLLEKNLVDLVNLVGTGGLWKALCESLFSGQSGHFSLELPPEISVPAGLFNENLGLLVATKEGGQLQSIAGELGVRLGTINTAPGESSIAHESTVVWKGEVWDWNAVWQDRLRTVV